MAKFVSVKLDDVGYQPPCISYKIPLEDIHLAQSGTPKESLTMVKKPEVFPDNFDWSWKVRARK